MNASEFKAWLEGYMLDRANPDPQVIAEKAAEMRQGPFVQPPIYMSPRSWEIRPYVTCGDPIGTAWPGGITNCASTGGPHDGVTLMHTPGFESLLPGEGSH